MLSPLRMANFNEDRMVLWAAQRRGRDASPALLSAMLARHTPTLRLAILRATSVSEPPQGKLQPTVFAPGHQVQGFRWADYLERWCDAEGTKTLHVVAPTCARR